ncbi:MAG: hypothetical protein R2759_09880 [Bacteroidales bacterium]
MTRFCSITPEGLAWAGNNEGLVWAFMIKNECSIPPNPPPFRNFLGEAPLPPFGKESPPRLGWFTGYRIVEAYMQKNNDVSWSN